MVASWLEDSAQGFNPGNRRPERFALKLKGRQIEPTNNGKVGPIVARQLRTLILRRSNRCELCRVSLSPFQGELVILKVPRVETLG
jgi:hypothetical protein